MLVISTTPQQCVYAYQRSTLLTFSFILQHNLKCIKKTRRDFHHLLFVSPVLSLPFAAYGCYRNYLRPSLFRKDLCQAECSLRLWQPLGWEVEVEDGVHFEAGRRGLEVEAALEAAQEVVPELLAQALG